MGAALRFKTTQVGRQQGELARLKVVRGRDHGVVYVVTGGRVVIGRGDENDVVLSDMKASRQHAELVLSPNGTWTVQDLNSANGILHNGRSVKTAILNKQDILTIGETTLEFLSADQATAMLIAPVRDPRQIETEQAALEVQKKKIRDMGVVRDLGAAAKTAPAQNPLGAGEASPLRRNKKQMLLAAAAVVAVFALLSGNEESGKQATGKSSSGKRGAGAPDGAGPNTIDLKQFLPESGAPPIVKSADVLLRTGFREYWQGNWLRARAQFETVLQVSPNHPLALMYLRNCDTRIKEEVKWHLETGRKDFMTGRLKSSRGHFEAVLRLLYRERTHPAYIEANEQLRKVIKESRTGGEDA